MVIMLTVDEIEEKMLEKFDEDCPTGIFDMALLDYDFDEYQADTLKEAYLNLDIETMGAIMMEVIETNLLNRTAIMLNREDSQNIGEILDTYNDHHVDDSWKLNLNIGCQS